MHHELVRGDEVAITSAFEYAGGKTSRIHQELRRADGTLAAEVSSVSGMLDLERRRLAPDVRACWRRFASTPEVLGL